MDNNVNSEPQAPAISSLPPNNNMIWGILTTILCCLPLGIVSIVYASKVNGLWLAGFKTEALKAAKTAKNWAIAAAITAAAIWVLYIIFASLFGLAMFDILENLN